MGAWWRGFFGLGHRLVTHPRTVLMLVLMLALSWLAVQIYAGLVVTAVPTAIYDFDQSKVSRALWTSIASPREIELVETPATLDEAWERLGDGRLGALVVIPHGMSDALKKGRESAVTVAVDGGNILVGKNVFKALAKAVGQVSAGVQVTTLRKMGARKERSVSLAVPIALDERPIRNPGTNYGVYVAPGLVFFMLHIFVLLLGLTIFLPGQRPASALEAFGAMSAAFLVCTGIGMAFAYVWLRPLSIIPASGPVWTLVWVASLVALDLLMASSFVAIAATPLAGVQVTVLLGMMSMMLSGITWPTDCFPPLLQEIATWIPFTPFAKGLQTLLHIPAGFDELSQHLRSFARQAVLYSLIGVVGLVGRRIVARIRTARPAEGRAS
jgi:ABC-2 type transport system permease protein